MFNTTLILLGERGGPRGERGGCRKEKGGRGEERGEGIRKGEERESSNT